VRVRRVANGILLEPMVTDIDAWFAALDRFADVPFMEGDR
jgi:antitoxin VapB